MPKNNFITEFLALLTLSGLIISSNLYAEAISNEPNSENICSANIDARKSARRINDWNQLNKLAKEFQKNCQNSSDNKTMSIAYADMGASNLQFQNSMKALSISEECITIFYNNFDCHINKANALLELGKFIPANEYILSTYKLINHLIAENRLAMNSARQSTEIKQLVAERGELEKNLHDATTLLDAFYLGSLY
jgi:tetratricopeptide (TPR) repeat protein